MDLLESVLRTCNAEEYIKDFKKTKIDIYTLKQYCTEEDLKLLGIESSEIRKNILTYVSKLKVGNNPTVNVVDNKYVKLILSQIALHLPRHLATMTCANHRKDIVICDLKLNPAVKCLERSLNAFEQTLDNFETILHPKEKRRKSKYPLILSTILGTSLIIFFSAKYFIRLK